MRNLDTSGFTGSPLYNFVEDNIHGSNATIRRKFGSAISVSSSRCIYQDVDNSALQCTKQRQLCPASQNSKCRICQMYSKGRRHYTPTKIRIIPAVVITETHRQASLGWAPSLTFGLIPQVGKRRMY